MQFQKLCRQSFSTAIRRCKYGPQCSSPVGLQFQLSQHAITTKAIRIREQGGTEMMKLEKISLPSLEDGQILIENKYAGLNFIDTYQRSGLYPIALPATLGMDGAGVVMETTPLAETTYGVKEGDRVSYYDFGSYAQHKILDAAKSIPIPDSVGFDTAAACVVQGLTAHYLCRSVYPLSKDEWCVVHAAAGGVGQFLTQIAKNVIGANMIGTTSNEEKTKLALSRGADIVVHYRDLIDTVSEATNGAGVSVVFDGVGQSTYETSLAVLRRRGMGVFYGNASGPVPPIEPLKLMRGGSLFITRCGLKDYVVGRDELLSRATELFQWIADGKVKVTIDKTFDLADVADAHEYIETGQTLGKVVFKCN